MDAIQQQYARMQRTIDEIAEVARSFKDIANNDDIADRLRTPVRLIETRGINDMNTSDLELDLDVTKAGPEDDTAVVFDCTATIHDDESRTPCPGTELSRGRYEAAMLRKLNILRGNLRHLNDRRQHSANRFAQSLVLARINTTLDLIRKVQTYLNKMGSWSFLLVDEG